MTQQCVITVARGFGSGGKEIAVKLSQELGIKCYEHRILTLAAQLSGVGRELFEQVDEKVRRRRMLGLLRSLPAATSPRAEGKFVTDDQLFAYQKQIIEELADSESCIIVGKCADWLLRDRPNVISVYIEAPRPFCRRRIMEKMGVTEAVADASISQTDKYRAEYYAYYTHGNYWTNPVNYDLTLNSERVGVDNCVRVIKSYMAIKYPGIFDDEIKQEDLTD